MSSAVPVVLSREDVDQVFAHLDGTMWLVAALLYGAGLRLQECLELRVKDLDFDRHEVGAMGYLHVLNRGGLGVRSPFDRR